MPGTIVNHPDTTGLVRHPSTLDINHPASSGATNHPSGFSGNFAALFTSLGLSPLQVVQSDLGVTYGGTLLDTGGTGPVLTLTGTLNAGLPVVPIRVKCTLGGALGVWTYGVSYDGGSTFPQTGTSAASVVLTGAGAGLTVGIAAGVAVLNNTWNATISAWADQSGNLKDYSQATASGQPLVTVGLNGHPGVACDGINDRMTSALDLPPPGTTPTFVLGVWRLTGNSPGAVGALLGDTNAAGIVLYAGAGTVAVKQFNGLNGPTVNMTIGTWGRTEAYWSNSTSDYLKFGATTVTGTNTSNTDSLATRCIGAVSAGTSPIPVEFLMLAYLNSLPSAAQLAAFSAAVTSFYGNSVSV